MRLDDGHSTSIGFASAPSILFWEKEVTPPGVDGGGPNETTVMANTAWRTFSPKKLKTLTEASASVAYDPAIFGATEAAALVNINNLITITFPAGDTLAFWGWLMSFTPGAAVEGAPPTADITVHPSNQNDAGAEVGPIHTPV